MATPPQALANHANAQLSTGPRTDSGKNTSSQNATRHALTARGLIVPLGLESAFAGLEEELRVNLIPVGGLEDTIFARILECAWNLQRCRLAQAQLFEKAADLSIDPLLDDQNEAKLNSPVSTNTPVNSRTPCTRVCANSASSRPKPNTAPPSAL